MGVKCKILFNKEAENEAKFRKKIPLTEVRIMPSKIITPALIDIGGGYVTMIIVGERPLCIIIKNNKIYESYLNYFKLLWDISKPI